MRALSLYGSLGSIWEIPIIKLYNYLCHKHYEELPGSFPQYLGKRNLSV